MHAEEISQLLGVVRSNVSTSLKELQNWNLVRIAHLAGDRRDHFVTSHDVWELFKTVVRERKEREFDPTTSMLRGCVADKAFNKERSEVQKRISDTLELMESLSAWTDEMLQLEPETIKKIMKLGSRIQKLVRG
jgi:DNA-binding transcriptional regulator GbsR (MarR family)